MDMVDCGLSRTLCGLLCGGRDFQRSRCLSFGENGREADEMLFGRCWCLGGKLLSICVFSV